MRVTVTPYSEKDAKLAQKLGQLQPFIAVFPPECTGQLAYFGPTFLTPSSLKVSGAAVNTLGEWDEASLELGRIATL